MNQSMTLDELRALLASDKFHHATYRDHGTIWEGLYIYQQHDGLRGFDIAGVFGKNSPDLDAAHAIVRHTGVSVGSYGNG
jgi:hypothetical protein